MTLEKLIQRVTTRGLRLTFSQDKSRKYHVEVQKANGVTLYSVSGEDLEDCVEDIANSNHWHHDDHGIGRHL